MRATGYALIGIAAVLVLFTLGFHLIVAVTPVERAGPVNAAPIDQTYLFALIPAVIAGGIGVWLLAIRVRGYVHTYDPPQQQPDAG